MEGWSAGCVATRTQNSESSASFVELCGTRNGGTGQGVNSKSWAEVYRFVPAGTAWDRLGPDKFFSPLEKGMKNWRSDLCCGWQERHGLWWVGKVRIRPF
jgi:hypothetical protein